MLINGPNLNMVGIREKGIYGVEDFESICAKVKGEAEKRGIALTLLQSNLEGEIVGFIQQAYFEKYDAIIINPGAYTHYSYAILDALKAVDVPAYEVHISHIDRRESFRAVSVTAPACVGQLYGHGFDGYLMAMDHFLEGRA